MTTLPNRRSIRLPHYDYTIAGGYFITICAHDRQPLFVDARTARIVRSAWDDIPSHHAHVDIDQFVVMPNHVHGVLFLRASVPERERAQRVAPRPPHKRQLAPGALGAIVRAFKARVTRNLRAEVGSDLLVWQRNYHEHVIRDEPSLQLIRQYIIDNPARWAFDHENPIGRPDAGEREFTAWLRRMRLPPSESAGAAR